MTDEINQLESMMAKTADLMGQISADQLRAATPCEDFEVRALLEHLATWVQVFDKAVNETELAFDPSDHQITEGWAQILKDSSARIIAGLHEHGVDRPMTMTTDPIPGIFVLNMMLMEYIGHGWDLAKARGVQHSFTETEAQTALAAAQSIIQPEYRGTGMFDHEVPAPPNADAMAAFIAFTGRDPNWLVVSKSAH